ncbi:MAG: rhomboid family intramembrane serine protease [Chloroherpetonaceae bacterium]|nr:rhomboid family intramembrane serine protease [Chloroherpetonaceae bacterium]
MRIKYNSPVILTFTLLSFFIMTLSSFFGNWLTLTFFAIPGSLDYTNPLTYLRLFTHIIGHADWNHFISNFSLLLLLGPLLEEKYGSKLILFMIVLTALSTGILNAIFFHNGILGASGIVFMLILMSSFTDFEAGEIPLTFILVSTLFFGKELISSFGDDKISQFAHMLGGISGSLFGFIYHRKGKHFLD